MAVRGDAPVESPFQEWERLIRCERVERRIRIEPEVGLRPDPPPQAADGVDGDMKVREVRVGDHLVLGVMERNRRRNRLERRVDIRNDGTQSQAESGAAKAAA
jgi:hypothetical protein